MASGTINFAQSATSGSYIDGKIEWTSTTNPATNTSVVTASLYVRKANTGMTLTIPTEGTWTYGLVVNGTSWSGSVSKSVLENWVLLTTKTSGAISHTTDGSKSITISGSITAPSVTSFKGHTTHNDGETVYLDTITRPTTVDSLTCSTIYVDGVITAKYTPKKATYYNRRIMYVNVNGTLTEIHRTNLGQKPVSQQTHDMQFNDTELSLIYSKVTTNANATIRVTFQTYSDSGYKTQIGQDQFREISLTLPPDVFPSFTFNITPVNSNSWINSKGIYVAGLSGATATVNAKPGEGATLTSTTITYDGVTYNAAQVNVTTLKKSGSIKFSATATDTRGRMVAKSSEIAVFPYSTPVITNLQVERGTYDTDNASWTTAEDGPDVKAIFKTTLALTSNGNTYAATFKVDGSDTAPNYGATSGLKSATEYAVYFVNLDGEASRTLTLTATDKVGSAGAAKLVIPTIHITIEYNDSGKGIAFGKTSEKDAFECGWDAEFKKNVSIEGELRAKHIARLDYYDKKNFNDLIYKTGYYTSTSAPSSTECSNYPINKTGVLEVISQMSQNATTGKWWGFAYQTYRAYSGEVYTRSYYSDTGWTSWVAHNIDTIVEQGTSGIWTYRKYSSGIAECWGVHTQTNLAIDTAWGGLYESKGYAVDLPNNLFVSTPVFSILLTGSGAAGSGMLLETYSVGSKTQSPYICAIRPNSVTVDTVNTSICAKGKWK